MDNCDIEWFALETNRDHSVGFEIASKYCISDSFVDHDGYSISAKGFLPIVVDIMVICVKFTHSSPKTGKGGDHLLPNFGADIKAYIISSSFDPLFIYLF